MHFCIGTHQRFPEGEGILWYMFTSCFEVRMSVALAFSDREIEVRLEKTCHVSQKRCEIGIFCSTLIS
jgi:hypothetical protein